MGMKKQFFYFLFFAFAIQIVAQPSISIEAFGSSFDKPVSIKHAGDSRLFVIEQEGFIRILNADGTVNSQAFLDIEIKVGGSGVIGDERGFLGLAFHPNYVANGFFYVNYTNNSGTTIVSRFSVSSTNANVAEVTSELILLTISQPNVNHNGGDMAFGADGFLYISSGDGGGSGDQTNKGQDLGSLLGKLLRIDVDNTSNGTNYAIPTSNPFVGNTNALDEIWAYGVRNPWKFSFDRQTNDIWIADVGQGSFEEINRMASAASGVNYGWRCYEGNQTFNTGGCPTVSTLTFPVATYAHSGTSRCSITGGYRYRGSQYPNFNGLYFFADYCSNEIGVLEENGTNWDLSFTAPFAGKNWVTFGEDINGEIYIADIGAGILYKIKDSTLSLDDPVGTGFKMYPNPVNDRITFEFNNVTLPEMITFYDIQGRVIKNIEQFSQDIFTVSVQNFTKGVYLIEISAVDGKKMSKKLIIN